MTQGIWIARFWGVYAKPKPNEDRFISELERVFPGSEWQGTSRPPQTRRASRLELLSLVDRALAYGQHVQKNGPPSASTSSEPGGSRRDALPSGGTGAYDFIVIGGGKYNLRELEEWRRSLGADARILTGSGKRGAEARLLELGADEHELRPDLYGPRARDVQVEALVAAASLTATPLVLVGTGTRVTDARAVLKRLGPAAPPLVELP